MLEKITNGDLVQKLIEMKNWKKAYDIEGATYKQFKAYLTSGKEFDYYFSDGIQDAMKIKFQNLFKNSAKAQELFDANPGFFTSLSLDITSYQKLHLKAQNGELLDLINWIK